jgi:4-amino-4-deoxy-L-arabinose transferase-like glycosyltransferase
MLAERRDGRAWARPSHFETPFFERCSDAGAIAILLLVTVVTAVTFRDYGLGWDDYTHSQYGEQLLAFYGSGFADRRALEFVNLYHYGGGFDMAAALAAKVLPFDLFETRRLAGGAVGIVGMIAVWRIGRRLGGPLAGAVAAALIATCPLYVGHMFMNPKDAPFAAAMALLILAMVRLLESYPQPGAGTVGLFGLGLGLSVGSRVLGFMSALYLLPSLALLLAVDTRRGGSRVAAARIGRFVLALLPGFVLAYLVMASVWPWSALSPLNPLRAVGYFSHFFEDPWGELFNGVVIPVIDMPRSYVPTLMALKLPVIFLLLGLGGAVGALVASARSTVEANRRAMLLMLALAALLPVAIAIATRPAMYNGIRHFLFILPPLAALGGLCAAWIAQRLRGAPLALGAATAVLGAGLALPAIAMVRLHPYEYTYFNSASGGMPSAARRFMLDYWGLSLKQASQALLSALKARGERPPPGGTWKIAVCGPHPPARVALGPGFELTWDPKGADFAMMLGTFYCATLDAQVLVEIDRAGIAYARVYDIRGRSVDSILTRPPP